MADRPDLYGSQHRAIRSQLRATWTHCYRCGQPLDWSLAYRDPETGRVNPEYPTRDHKQSVALFPELASVPANQAASHDRCNKLAGARPTHPGLGFVRPR